VGKREHKNVGYISAATFQSTSNALGSILGQAFKGYKGCTWCMDETGGI
jgi:hypothetical protein